MKEAENSPAAIRPTLGVVALTVYGVGNMLGAGIYGLERLWSVGGDDDAEAAP